MKNHFSLSCYDIRCRKRPDDEDDINKFLKKLKNEDKKVGEKQGLGGKGEDDGGGEKHRESDPYKQEKDDKPTCEEEMKKEEEKPLWEKLDEPKQEKLAISIHKMKMNYFYSLQTQGTVAKF